MAESSRDEIAEPESRSATTRRKMLGAVSVTTVVRVSIFFFFLHSMNSGVNTVDMLDK